MKRKVVVYYEGFPLVIIDMGDRVFVKKTLLDWYSNTYGMTREKLDCCAPLDEINFGDSRASGA